MLLRVYSIKCKNISGNTAEDGHTLLTLSLVVTITVKIEVTLRQCGSHYLYYFFNIILLYFLVFQYGLYYADNSLVWCISVYVGYIKGAHLCVLFMFKLRKPVVRCSVFVIL